MAIEVNMVNKFTGETKKIDISKVEAPGYNTSFVNGRVLCHASNFYADYYWNYQLN